MHGQILVDVLIELQALHGDLESLQHSSPLHLLMMSLDCPLKIRHKKGEYILCMEIGGFFVLW